MNNKYNKVFKYFSAVDSKYNLFDFGYLPRWIIICIDLFLVSISFIITHLLIVGLKGSDTISEFNTVSFIVVAIINVFFFFVFKTFSGIIRHSSFVDALKLVFSTLSSFITLVILNYFIRYTFNQSFFLTTELGIAFLFSFSLLFLFRLVVKQFFLYFKSITDVKKSEKVVILGVNNSSVAIATAIHRESPIRFDLIGFITTNNNNKKSSNLQVLGKTVYHVKSVKNIVAQLRKLKIKALILSNPKLSSSDLFAIVDKCVEQKIKVYNAPLISNTKERFNSNQIKALKIEDLLNRKVIELDDENKSKEFENKAILVTGAAGSIGSEIVRQLTKYNPKKIIILDQAETPTYNLQIELETEYPNLNFKTIIGDVGNREKLEKIFAKETIDIVFHAAAYKHVPLMEANPSEAIFVNICGTKHLADLSVKYNVNKFVMVSTDKAVNPSNVMGASKRVAEMYVQSLFYKNKTKGESSTKFITTRFGNVLGSNGSVVPLFKKQIEAGGPVTITHPDIIRYFMTIPEACQLVLEAGTMGKGGEIYIFDMGEPVKIMDLAKRMIKLCGYIPNVDIEIKTTGLRPGEKLYEELLSDKSKTMPTHHEKIMIGIDRTEDYVNVSNQVDHIIASALNLDNNLMVKNIKNLVPEYISLNSEYEILDSNL